MVESTLIYRDDALPLCGLVDEGAPPELAEQKRKVKLVVQRITPNLAPQALIESGAYTVHYVVRDHLVLLVIADKLYLRQLAFAYLDEVLNEFLKTYGNECFKPGVRPYAFEKFDSFLTKTRKVYLDARAQNNLDRLHLDLTDVKKVMTKNIEDLLYRGDLLDKMLDLSDLLKLESKKYRRAAQRINLEALIRQYVPVACVLLLFVFLVWYVFLR